MYLDRVEYLCTDVRYVEEGKYGGPHLKKVLLHSCGFAGGDGGDY
jgi:hypothetical protein